MTPKQVFLAAKALLARQQDWRQGNYDGLHPERPGRVAGKLDLLEAVWEASAHNPDDANAAIVAAKNQLPANVRSLSLLNDTATLVQLRAFIDKVTA